MAINDLLLTDSVQEEKEDDVLSSLLNIAYVTPKAQEPEKPADLKERRSRFFYRPTESFSTDLDNRKRAQHPPPLSSLTILDKEVEARKVTYASELPDSLQSNIESVREFFLNEIGPLTLAAQAGTAQAREVVQRTLNTEIDGLAFAQFERMVGKGATLKMARFIAGYLGLPRNAVESILNSIQPTPPKEAMFFPLPDSRRPPKEKPETPLGD
jgi:hypothetical protein